MEEYLSLLKLIGSQRIHHSQGVPGLYKMNILSGTVGVCFVSLPTGYTTTASESQSSFACRFEKTTCHMSFLCIFATCFLIKCLKENISRNKKFADSPGDMGNTKGSTRWESIVLTCVRVEKDTARWYPCSFKWKNNIAGVAGGHLATHPVLRVGDAA